MQIDFILKLRQGFGGIGAQRNFRYGGDLHFMNRNRFPAKDIERFERIFEQCSDVGRVEAESNITFPSV